MTGKKAGNGLYIHVSAITTLSPTKLTRVLSALISIEEHTKEHDPDFKDVPYNFLIIHPNYIERVEAEDFDTTHEPVLGQRYRVDHEGNVTYIQRLGLPRVLHQKYKTVQADYKGFDIEADKKREEWYRSHFDSKRMAGAGFEHKWIPMLAEIAEKNAEATCNP